MIRLTALVLVSLVACSSEQAPAPKAPSPPAAAPVVALPASEATAEPPAATVSYATAMTAYNAKDYQTCAAQFVSLARTVTAKHRKQDMLYSAACCQSLAKTADDAFNTLDEAIALGFTDVAQVDMDDDLVNLRSDARWKAFHDRISAAQSAMEKSLTKPALRRELLTMVQRDQEARFAALNADKAGDHDKAKALWPKVEEVDNKDTARLRDILAKDGWPTRSMVGEDGAHAAWLLVQHADKDVAFQKQVLAMMKPLADKGEVGMVDYAYLEDRVAVAEHRKQRFGTQFTAEREPSPIEDEAHVDERRTAIGMPTMAEYRAQMTAMYGPAPAPAKK